MSDLCDLLRFPIIAFVAERAKSHGLSVTLVGGAVRDYLLNGTLSKDLDFEIMTKKSEEDFKKSYQDFLLDFKKRSAKITYLPFSIARVEYLDFIAEFSPPRVEEFTDDTHHKNFTPVIKPSLQFKESYLRRDFTINAIGLDLGSMKLVDPSGGVDDLKASVLRPVGGDFYRDPVRFLRAIRFNIRLHFRFHSSLVASMERMSLLSLTDHYFCEEAKRSGNISAFIALFSGMVKKLGTPVPPRHHALIDLVDLKIESKNFEEYLFLQFNFMKRENSEHLLKLFSIKEVIYFSIDHFYSLFDEISKRFADKKIQIDSLPGFESPLYDQLSLFHQSVSKLSTKIDSKLLKAKLLEENHLPIWLVDSLIHPLLGKEQFDSILSDRSIPNEQRRGLRFYCHLSEVLSGN